MALCKNEELFKNSVMYRNNIVKNHEIFVTVIIIPPSIAQVISFRNLDQYFYQNFHSPNTPHDSWPS